MFIHKQLPAFDAVQAGGKAICTIERDIRLAALDQLLSGGGLGR
jgi:hypothetical protein